MWDWDHIFQRANTVRNNIIKSERGQNLLPYSIHTSFAYTSPSPHQMTC